MSESGFAALLRAWRDRAALTQEELAERSGLSVRAIRDLEHGRVARPRRETVRMLATALELCDDEREELLLLARQRLPAARPGPVGAESAAAPATKVPADVAAPHPVVVRTPATRAEPPTGGRKKRHTVNFAMVLTAALLTVNAQSCYRGQLAAPPSHQGPSAAAASRDGSPTPHPTRRVTAARWLASDDLTPGQASTEGDDLQVLSPVTRGETLIVTVALTGAGLGPVTVTDTVGNQYRAAGRMVSADTKHRLLLFAVISAKPMDTLDEISVHWPGTTDAHVAVDVFDGVTSAGPSRITQTDNGHSGESESITGKGPLVCPPGGYLFTAVSTPDGTAAQLDQTWRPLAGPQLPSPALTTAYRSIASANDHCEAHGTAARPWQILTLHLS